MDDVSFILNDIKFNYRVAAIIKHDDKVLLHKNINDDFYAIPGGRIKVGENSEFALKREFIEEMNAKIIIKEMLAIVENFFNYDNKKYHEIMLIYKCEFQDSNFNNLECIEGVEKKGELQFVWKRLNDLNNLDIRPTNIKNLIYNETDDISHIIDNYKTV